jgi:hypothetical protein
VTTSEDVRHPDTGADIDSRTAGQLMHLDAFAHHGLGSSGPAVLAALSERDGQSLTELQASASISRSTAYRQLGKLKTFGDPTTGEVIESLYVALDGRWI